MSRRLLALLLLTACGEPAQLIEREPPPPGLQATPRWLTFTCLEPGCDQTETTTIQVVGGRGIAIKRLLLSDRERTDFEVQPSQEPPFVLQNGASFTVGMRHLPSGDPRLTDVDLLVTYTDASASESDPDRIPPGELHVPLVRRLIGEPKLTAGPDVLSFGAVAVGAERALPLTVHNEGFGNVGLVLDTPEATPPEEIRVDDLPSSAMLPGESRQLSVVWAPATERFLRGSLRVSGVGSATRPVNVSLLGTSIAAPTLGFEPALGVDFGEVPVPSMGMAELLLTNQGRQPLFISGIELAAPIAGGSLSFALVNGATTATVAALETVPVHLVLDAQTPGEVNTLLRIHSNDPQHPLVEVPVVGLMTQPIIKVEPPALDWGNVPRGWSVVQHVEISNEGYGGLVISYADLVLGSASLFSLRTVPSLPATLQHGQRIGLELEFRSEVEAPFTGTLAVDSNDAANPFVEVPLAAVGASCDLGCPIIHGTPTCSSGSCEIEACEMGYYDTDSDPVSGCECAEPASDAGSFCADSVYVGGLGEGDQTSASGIIPLADDIDVVRFYADDETGFFDEDFDVHVTLTSADPGLRFCVYRHHTGGHLNECYFDEESCPGDLHYRDEGDLGPDDSGDYVVKVFRAPGSAPTCTPYALFIRNG